MVLVLVTFASCAADGDVTGPFSGPIHRFAIDALWLPRGSAQDSATRPSQLGSALGWLDSLGDATIHAADMIAAGAIASSIELQGDNLSESDAIGARYIGTAGDDAIAVGARIVGGVLTSNRGPSAHLGMAHVRLPVFADADPIMTTLVGVELGLVPDGVNGYVGTAYGGIPASETLHDMLPALRQMIAASPFDHLTLVRMLDRNRDGQITEAEVSDDALFASVLAPDVMIAGEPAFSVRFQLHAVSCDTGACDVAGSPDLCHDRVIDGDESDIDCGGSCAPCPGGGTCRMRADCQTGGCAVGRCAAPTCSDGLGDGVESDVDCGGPCAPCVVGSACAGADDCASGRCSADIVYGPTIGTCQP